MKKDAATSLTLSETELEQVRSDREGLEWLHEFLAEEGALETVQPGGAPSAAPISGQAFDLIVEFEVTGEQAYTQRYRRPVWPKGQSGVTIGIGYDVGYAAKPLLWADWGGAIPDAMITALEGALGVTGTPASAVAKRLQSTVDVPWQGAIKVHREKVLPRWVGLVERSLSNTGMIGPDCLGALVSLTYKPRGFVRQARCPLSRDAQYQVAFGVQRISRDSRRVPLHETAMAGLDRLAEAARTRSAAV